MLDSHLESGRIFTLLRIGAAAFALWLLAATPAGAACISFEKTASGDAYLINSCQTDMNVAYCVKDTASVLDCGRGFNKLPVAGETRKLLWPGSQAPVAGTYEVNVLFCTAPATLVYHAGSPPKCKVDSADAG